MSKYTDLQQQEIVLSWCRYKKWKNVSNPGEQEFIDLTRLLIVRKTLYNYAKKWENITLTLHSYKSMPRLAQMQWEKE
jgi:hypothetical protein